MILTTQGSKKNKVTDMAIGDYITARYTTTSKSSHGTISELGTVDTIQLAQYDTATTLDGYIFLMKIAKGVLISTHQLYSGTTYKSLNDVNRINGSKITLAGKDFLLRIPTQNEYARICSNLDGKLDIADKLNNFGVTTSTCNELENRLIFRNDATMLYISIANINTNVSTSVATSTCYLTASVNARLVLEYADDKKCTDLFH